MRRIHVDTVIRADLDTVWLRTQDPAPHQRWDARFGRIEYLEGAGPQRFRYATLNVAGIGTTVGERLRPDGCRTSALRFASGHPLSPIRLGSGARPAGPPGARLAHRVVVRPAPAVVRDRPNCGSVSTTGAGW